MSQSRRDLLWLVVGLAVLAALTLWEVLGTVLFAISVAIVAEPLYDWLCRRLAPYSEWWAAAATTLVVFGTVVGVVAPFVVVLYRSRGDVIDFLESLPETILVGTGEFQYSVETVEALDLVRDVLSSTGIGLAAAAPELALKLTLFTIVLFALLLRQRQAASTLLSAVPPEYRETTLAMTDRLRSTLVALYVLQAATAAGTFLVALPTFWLLGYDVPVVLALLAGLLQFLPIVGPSLLVAAVAAFELVTGDPQGAMIVAVVAGLVVAALPDAVIRPRLARWTARLPGSLYFIGFTGGLLTVGPIGIIAGPVVVALLLEALTLLAEEIEGRPTESLVEGPSGE